MKVLGIHISKGQFRFAVIEGTKNNPVLIDKGRMVTTNPQKVPQLMDWYDTHFRELVDKFKPEKIAYRLTLNPRKEQLFTSEFPFGILNLLAHQQGIPIVAYSPQSFVPSKLGLPKNTNILNYCDDIFGSQPPYWDDNQRYSILVAWFEV